MSGCHGGVLVGKGGWFGGVIVFLLGENCELCKIAHGEIMKKINLGVCIFEYCVNKFLREKYLLTRKISVFL